MLLLSLTLMLCGCGKKSPNTDGTSNSTQNPSDSIQSLDTSRKPILSLADLMIDKLTNSKHHKDAAVMEQILKLREYDKTFYKALYNEYNTPSKTLPKRYFYARLGSCCPCMAGGEGCCRCSSATAFGAPNIEEIAETKSLDKDTKGLKFMFAKANVVPQGKDTRKLLEMKKERNVDGIDIFIVPENSAPGPYFYSFKGKVNLIDITLLIDIDKDHKVDIKIE